LTIQRARSDHPRMSRSNDEAKRIRSALRGSAVLGAVPLRQLATLVDASRDVPYGQGDVVYDEGVAADAFYVVLSGRLHDYGRDAQGKPMLRRQLRPGDTFGETAVVLRMPTRSRVIAGEATRVARFAATDLEALMRSSAAVRRALAASTHPHGDEVRAVAASVDEEHVEVVALHVGRGWPASAAARSLAQALVKNHRDRVAILRVMEQQSPGQSVEEEGVPVVAVGPDPEAFLESAEGRRWRGGHDFLLVDLERADPDARRAWTAHSTKVAPLREPGDVAPIAGLADAAEVRETILLPDRSIHPTVLPPGATRVRIHRGELDRPLGAWSAAGRRSLDRWARQVSDRSVGLALSGGGAWGYAHVALIEELTERGIPIDIVGGVSFGAVVGAYYCAKGDEGLRRLVASGPRLARVIPLAMLTSWIIERHVQKDVGDPWLEDLETVFLPVACDIAAAETVALRGVGLALGTRASGSFPMVFGPTTTFDPASGRLRRYVDAGISDNVPDAAVLAEGADLIVASNIVPPPEAEQARPQRFPGRIGRALHELNPFDRLVDGYRSTFMLFHTAGNSEITVDAVLNGRQTGHPPVAFDKAREILDLSRPLARETSYRALDRWKAMQGGGNRA
jgi:NTE family protein